MKSLIKNSVVISLLILLLGKTAFTQAGCGEGELRFHFYNLITCDETQCYRYFLKAEKLSPEWGYDYGYNLINALIEEEIEIVPDVNYYGTLQDYNHLKMECAYLFAYGNYKFSFIKETNDGDPSVILLREVLSYFTVDYTDGNYNVGGSCFSPRDMHIKFVNDPDNPNNSIFYYSISKIPNNPSLILDWQVVQNHIVPFISVGAGSNCNRKVDVFKPAAPSNLRIKNNSILNWDCNGETFLLNYIIYRKQGSGSYAAVCTLNNIKNQGYDDPIYWQKGHSFSWTEPNPHGIVRYYIVAENMSGTTHLKDTSSILAYNYDLEKNSDQDNETSTPSKYALYSNYPNPFNPTTTIKYSLKEDVKVSLKIYNLLGQEVRTLVNENQSAGYKRVVWDGKNDRGVTVPSGLYIYKMIAGSFVKAQKMVLMK